MSFILEGLNTLTSWLVPHYSAISIIVGATILVIYGDVINKHIKRALSPYHFIIRTAAFVLLCAFGYGALILVCAPWIKQGILWIPSTYQGVVIVIGFLLLGYLAENRRYI